MKRMLVLAASLAACREAGTITVGQSDVRAQCEMPVFVTVDLVPKGQCGQCMCEGGCPGCNPATGCLQKCQQGCSVDDEIVFDSPKAGAYAALLTYENAGHSKVAVVCAQIVVETDGTTSTTEPPETLDCCTGSASSAGEPFSE